MSTYNPDQVLLVLVVGTASVLLYKTLCSRNTMMICYPTNEEATLQTRVYNLAGLCQKDEDAIVQHKGIRQYASCEGRHPITSAMLDRGSSY